MSEAKVLIVTADAVAKILEIREGEDQPDSLALRVEVTGVSGVEYRYELSFETLGDPSDGDVVEHHDNLPVMVPADSIDKLRGATLDLPSSEGQQGLVLRNPNRPNLFGDDDLELTGTVEERIAMLLERQINPAIAAHGGFAELITVDGEVAVVKMGGGCQGCGMAAATLRNGIETAIVDQIPEITSVADATDHAAGENPYYATT
ncbi:MAG TPA: NifU family protein [Acidimicrobiales bacterium]|jgi:Fe/S biogenesis protein NfuA